MMGRSLQNGRAFTSGKRWGESNGGVGILVEQVCEPNKGTNKVLLLLVILDGGHYGEDQDSRIRSHRAILSALPRSAYPPEDAEHL
jgi:hypothetical protein